MTEVLGHTKKTESVDLFSDFNFAFLSNIKKHEREDDLFSAEGWYYIQYCLVICRQAGAEISRRDQRSSHWLFFFFHHVTQTFFGCCETPAHQFRS